VRSAERDLARNPHVEVTTKILEGDPARVIVGEAEASTADLIVMGSHGRGAVKRAVLGSVSQAVAAHAPCSVEIVRCQQVGP
jgi:nucleotide-binding universal stress UspA family protein